MPVYVAFLGVDSFAIIGVYASVSALLGILDGGLSVSLTRIIAQSRGGDPANAQDALDMKRSMEWMFGTVSTIVVLAALLMASQPDLRTILPNTLPDDLSAPSIVAIGFALAFQFICLVYNASLIGLDRQVEYSWITALGATIRNLGVIAAMSILGKTLLVFYAWNAACYLIQAVAQGIVSYSCMPSGTRRSQLNLHLIRREWGFIGSMAMIHVIGVLILYSDRLVLAWLVPLPQLSSYHLAGATALVISMLSASVFSAVFPRFSSVTSEIEPLYLRVSQWLVVGVAPPLLILIAFPDTFLQAWLKNPQLVETVRPLLLPLNLAAFINVLAVPSFAMQLSRGKSNYALLATGMQALIFFPVLFILGSQIGMMGAAVAQLTGQCVMLTVSLRRTHGDLLQISVITWLAAVAPHAAAGCICAYLLSLLPRPAATGGMIIFLGAATIVLYLAVVAASGSTRAEVLRQLKARLRPA